MKVMNDWVLIKLDPDEEKVGGGTLFKPEGAYEHILRTGEVLQVGPGKWCKGLDKRQPMGIEVGEGVVFIRFVADSTKTAQAIQATVGKDQALIRRDDILLAYDRDNPPRFG